MKDSVDIDTNKYHHDLAKYNRAIEAMIPIVEDDYTFFESFLMDEYEDVYNGYSEESLKLLHKNHIIQSESDDEMFNKWQEYVLDEVKRRIDG